MIAPGNHFDLNSLRDAPPPGEAICALRALSPQRGDKNSTTNNHLASRKKSDTLGVSDFCYWSIGRIFWR